MVQRAEPGFTTQAQVYIFFRGMANKYPEMEGEIKKLETTLKTLPDDLNNKLVAQMEADTSGSLEKARVAIDKDPSIIAQINRDPAKLAQIMGVAVPAPAVQAQAPAQSAGAPAATPQQQPAPVAAAPAPAPAVAALSPIQEQVKTKFGEITQMKGFDELLAKTNDGESGASLKRAMDAMMAQGNSSPEEQLKALEEIQKDPEFFEKVNRGIEEIPPQMRENVFSNIAENPALGRAALSGDGGAKMQLMMSSMMGGAGGGLSGLMGPNSPLQGIMQMLGNLLPKLMEGLMQTMKPMLNSLKSFAGSSGFMAGMGNGNGELIKQYSRTVDNALGTQSGETPVVDARDPQNAPARPLQQYAGPYEPTGKIYNPPEPQQQLAQGNPQQPALGTS